MADFASFKVRDEDEPQIINLDNVDFITTEYIGEQDTEAYEAHIVFSRAPVVEAGGELAAERKTKRWWDSSNKELMRWVFAHAATDKDIATVKKFRDEVIERLFKGERQFTLQVRLYSEDYQRKEDRFYGGS